MSSTISNAEPDQDRRSAEQARPSPGPGTSRFASSWGSPLLPRDAMRRSARQLIESLAGIAVGIVVGIGGWIGDAAGPSAVYGAEPVVIHEWGTFTTLQDETGQELPGINIDDEPVPPFVHNLHPLLLSQPFGPELHWGFRQKGAPRHHPHVTMRLETPIIYFHLPPTAPRPLAVDIDVAFRGGWLTEFFPNARPDAPGLDQGAFEFGALTPSTIGRLSWHDLQVGTPQGGNAQGGNAQGGNAQSGSPGEPPATDWPVWTIPRQVAADRVSTRDGEHEHYVFYRGVANQRAPLRTTLDRADHRLQLFANFDEVLSPDQTASIDHLWLVDIRGQDQVAFRRLDGVTVSADPAQPIAQTDSQFAPAEFGPQRLGELKQQMHRALVEDGLFDDEATALLDTWQRAYFQSPGLRLFFLVPQAWTDHYLPLSITTSAPIRLDRVMVARLELKSDRQAELLAELARTPVSDASWLERIPDSDARNKFFAGRIDFGDLGVEIPADYRLYLELGRFRNALVSAEEHQRPNPNWTSFINTYQLHPYRW
ncbi:MAG: hypothetical protein U0795_14850 [Pirellulales bacterium]